MHPSVLKRAIGRAIPWLASVPDKESVVFSLLEKKTETYLAFRIPGTTSEAVMNLMNDAP